MNNDGFQEDIKNRITMITYRLHNIELYIGIDLTPDNLVI